MAKGARASTTKANNAKLKSRVFGPVETARTERLNAKLMELISQPKPKREDVAMEVEDESTETVAPVEETTKSSEAMEVDQGVSSASNSKPSKGRIEKKRVKSSRKASIVFPRYKVGKAARSKGKGKK